MSAMEFDFDFGFMSISGSCGMGRISWNYTHFPRRSFFIYMLDYSPCINGQVPISIAFPKHSVYRSSINTEQHFCVTQNENLDCEAKEGLNSVIGMGIGIVGYMDIDLV